MLTWSLGWAPSPARLAITSLAFMFEEVPEPVWKTSIGNWSSCSPAATASPAAAIRSARSASSTPSSPLTRAAAAFSRPSQRTTGTGTRSPETGKLSTALVVSPPQSCSVKVRASIGIWSVRIAVRSVASAARPLGPASKPFAGRRRRNAGGSGAVVGAVAGGGGEAPDQLGVDAFGAVGARAGRRRAGSRAAGWRAPPGSARASALSLVAASTIAVADRGEVAGLLVLGQAVADRRLAAAARPRPGASSSASGRRRALPGRPPASSRPAPPQPAARQPRAATRAISERAAHRRRILWSRRPPLRRRHAVRDADGRACSRRAGRRRRSGPSEMPPGGPFGAAASALRLAALRARLRVAGGPAGKTSTHSASWNSAPGRGSRRGGGGCRSRGRRRRRSRPSGRAAPGWFWTGSAQCGEAGDRRPAARRICRSPSSGTRSTARPL